MPKPKQQPDQPGPSRITKGGIDLPVRAVDLRTPSTEDMVAVGGAVHRTDHVIPLGKRQMTAFGAARAGGVNGAAFDRWFALQGGDPRSRRTAEEWQPLIDQFTSRPIHGHRRS